MTGIREESGASERLDWCNEKRSSGSANPRSSGLSILRRSCSRLSAQSPDWAKINSETLRHFQALVQIDSTNPPGNETPVAEYVKKVLEAEGIP